MAPLHQDHGSADCSWASPCSHHKQAVRIGSYPSQSRWHSVLVKLFASILHVMTLPALLWLCSCFCNKKSLLLTPLCLLSEDPWFKSNSLIRIYFAAEKGDCSHSFFTLNVFCAITLLALSCCGWSSYTYTHFHLLKVAFLLYLQPMFLPKDGFQNDIPPLCYY